MTNKAAGRRLAAVLSADAAGYTRLMAADDVGTLELMASHRSLIQGLVRQHGGRVVDAVGDNALAEFASAVDAVSCALEVQRAVAAAGAGRSPEEQMQFRIGIHVGELVSDGDRIGGDGVNIAARVRTLAPPGKVAITATVLELVAGRLAPTVADLGEQEFRNVPRPVRTYVIEDAQEPATPALTRPGQRALDSIPGFAGRHAIAVLPFENLSNDIEQEYFADGLAADLIARLSALRLYPVIARNSSFAYRERNVDAREIGAALGAHYLVSGTVRRAGNRVRVVVEVVDAHDSHQLWTERYDRELSDIFDLQDEITESIAGAIGPVLSRSEIRHAMQREPADLDAWDCIHRGIWHLFQARREHNEQAREWAARALELQPRSATAHALLSFSHQYDIIYRWSGSQSEAAKLAVAAGERAVALDSDDPMALTALGYACNLTGQQARAIDILERAIEMNPSSALAYWGLGSSMTLSGRPDEALPLLDKAMRLSPRDPLMAEFLFSVAAAHFGAGRYERAVEYARRSLAERPNQPGAYRILAAALGFLGHAGEGAAALERLRELVPGMSVDYLRAFLPEEVVARYAEGFRRSGWPE